MSDGTHGHGTTLVGGSTGTVANVISITGPNQTRDSIDVSTMDSTSAFREFISGMLDPGEITFDVNYAGAAAGEANSLNTALTAAAETWTITFPDTSSWACSGFVTALGFGDPFDDKITQSVTIKFSGVPTFTDVA